MTKILDLEGRQVKDETIKTIIAEAGLSDDDAEKAGQAIEDPTALDDLGIPYFYPLDYGKAPDGTVVDPKKAQWAGKRIPPKVRRAYRKQRRKAMDDERQYLHEKVPRKELMGLFDRSIAPQGRQIQALTFTMMALKELLIGKKLPIRRNEFQDEDQDNIVRTVGYLEITENEFQDVVRRLAADYRKKALQQVAESEGVEMPDALAQEVANLATLAAEAAGDVNPVEQMTPPPAMPEAEPPVEETPHAPPA